SGSEHRGEHALPEAEWSPFRPGRATPHQALHTGGDLLTPGRSDSRSMPLEGKKSQKIERSKEEVGKEPAYGLDVLREMQYGFKEQKFQGRGPDIERSDSGLVEQYQFLSPSPR